MNQENKCDKYEKCIHHGMPLLADGSVCDCSCHEPPIETDGASGEGLDALIRDLTKIHPQPKSYVRKLLTEYLSLLHSQVLEELDKENSIVPISTVKKVINEVFKL